jgi:hypothetical protein
LRASAPALRSVDGEQVPVAVVAGRGHALPRRGKWRAPIGAGGDELQLSRAVRALVVRHDAGEYTRAQARPGDSPFGRSQTLESERLRQPAYGPDRAARG